MNVFPSSGPLTIDTQQIYKVEALGGNVAVTLAAMPDGSDGPSGQFRIRFTLEDTRELHARLTAAICDCKNKKL
jgi:hypothetical protein